MKTNPQNGSAYLIVLAAMLTLTLWVTAAIVVTFTGRAVSVRYAPLGGMYDLSVSAIHLMYNDLLEQIEYHHEDVMALLLLEPEPEEEDSEDFSEPDFDIDLYRALMTARLQPRGINYVLSVMEERTGGAHTDTYTIAGRIIERPGNHFLAIEGIARLGGSNFRTEARVIWSDITLELTRVHRIT